MPLYYGLINDLGNVHLTSRGEGGGYGFWGEQKFLSANLLEKNILLVLCALKFIVFIEKNKVATTCREKNSAALRSEKIF